MAMAAAAAEAEAQLGARGVRWLQEYPPSRTLTFKSEDTATKQPHRDLALDVFEPADLQTDGDDPSSRRPAIVTLFGGGWRTGTRVQMYELCHRLAHEHGLVAFACDYRVLDRDGATPSQCVQDARAAVRFVRAHAASLSVDPERVVAAGSSAGGHLAVCAALDPTLGASLCVAIAPAALSVPEGLESMANDAGLDSTTIPAAMVESEPWTDGKAEPVPMLLWHGRPDPVAPFAMTAGFARKIDERFGQGIATLVAHPTATHFIFSDAQIFEAMFASVASFLQTHGHTHTPEANPIEEGPSELPEGRLPPFARW